MQNNRPHIICHMMSTIDGKVASGIDGVDILADYFDLYTQTEDKLGGTAWMCGRVTMQMFASGVNTPLPTLFSDIQTTNFITEHPNKKFMFAIDTKGILRFNASTIKLGNVAEPLHLVVIVTEQTPKEYLAYLQEKQISYIFGGREDIDFEKLMQTLKETFGVEKLLLEGGALLNGSVMAANLIDEISLLLTPLVANRSSCPSLFERKIEEELQTKLYSLSEVKQLDKGTVWLRYNKI